MDHQVIIARTALRDLEKIRNYIARDNPAAARSFCQRLLDKFLEAVKAPPWHGKNFNALRDSIAAGDINEIEVPYRLVVKNYDKVPSQLQEMTGHFIDLINELHQEGVPIEISTEN